MTLNRQQFPENIHRMYFCLQCKNYYGGTAEQVGLGCPFCGNEGMKKILTGNSDKRCGGMNWAAESIQNHKNS